MFTLQLPAAFLSILRALQGRRLSKTTSWIISRSGPSPPTRSPGRACMRSLARPARRWTRSWMNRSRHSETLRGNIQTSFGWLKLSVDTSSTWCRHRSDWGSKSVIFIFTGPRTPSANVSLTSHTSHRSSSRSSCSMQNLRETSLRMDNNSSLL